MFPFTLQTPSPLGFTECAFGVNETVPCVLRCSTLASQPSFNAQLVCRSSASTFSRSEQIMGKCTTGISRRSNMSHNHGIEAGPMTERPRNCPQFAVSVKTRAFEQSSKAASVQSELENSSARKCVARQEMDNQTWRQQHPNNHVLWPRNCQYVREFAIFLEPASHEVNVRV